MSEVKSYRCDIPGCSSCNAMHFVIPGVDYLPGPIGPQDGQDIDGSIDLCRDHIGVMLASALNFMPDSHDRRRFWKEMLGK